MKKIGYFFAAIAVIFVGFGLFLSNHFEFSRSIVIKAPPAQIHHYVEDLEQWPKWSPWLALDPSIKTEIGEIKSGVGASQRWSGQSGGGDLTLTTADPATGITYDMHFGDDPVTYQSGIRYAVTDGGTRVSWWMSGDMEPIIIGNYFAQLMEGFVAKDFVRGLEKLKARVEADLKKTPAVVE